MGVYSEKNNNIFSDDIETLTFLLSRLSIKNEEQMKLCLKEAFDTKTSVYETPQETWHEEECLLRNPFYYELPLDCWPCEDVRTLVDLTGFPNYSSNYVLNEQPFIVRDSLQNIVSFNDLKNLYKDYNMALDQGTARFLCSEKDFCSPKDVFSDRSASRNSFQVTWKINRVAAARVVRKIFPRPYFIPNNSEVALERFLYLSGAEAPQFFLPLTDFANVWVAQGQGYRLIVLDPSVPCLSNCSTVSVLLRPRDYIIIGSSGGLVHVLQTSVKTSV
ncbi:uncharacterized protein CEXT_649111 [Caerostris extrusa]|uniref:Uncharacterized protein n=1 Tax=Caerostris extrusa TaxID=172846 RepID=A0AAV4NSJ9_CAEEX|nr:uncharacterized protein CEXT_649111 [Caerostris extrusa]